MADSQVSTGELTLPEGLTRAYLLHHRICPKARAPDGSVIVVVSPNALLEGLDDIGYAYRCAVTVQEASDEEVERLIERLATRSERLFELGRVEVSEDEFATDVRDLARASSGAGRTPTTAHRQDRR